MTVTSQAVHRQTGGLLLIASLGVYLAACASGSDVTSTGARSNQTSMVATSVAVDVTAPVTPSSEPTATRPDDDTTTTAAGSGRGEDGVGDTLFPSLGNPGIDVEHYTLILEYDPFRNDISANAHLDLVMTEDRQAFSLDSSGPDVSAVSVDGVPAEFDAAPPELLITPANALTTGQHVAVDVTYTLKPEPVPSAAGEQVGWFQSPGGSYVINEPEGTSTWMPCDDHPSDKATFRFELTVPAGVTAVANGALVEHTSTASGDTWIWQEDRPMATYLIQLVTGDYEIVDGVSPNGLPLSSIVLRNDRTKMQPYLDTIDDQIDFFDDYFGAYPLDRYGIAIIDSVPGLAMETLGRSQFSRDDFSSGRLDQIQELLLSHELSHQWFGDAVSPARWTDVWLNESFATYAEWMWLDHIGVQPIADFAGAGLAERDQRSPASPSVDEMFGFNSYDGGAIVLHALRKTIGDDLFFRVLRRWVADNNGSSRTTEEFVTLASKVAGQDLTEFFATWLYADKVPTRFPD